jgi:integrase
MRWLEPPTLPHFQRLYNDKKAGLSLRTVCHIHAVIHGALEQAMKNQLVVLGVSDASILSGGVQREIHPLTLDQMRQLLAAIRQDQLFPAILLELGTGLRRGSYWRCAGMTWTCSSLASRPNGSDVA